MNNKEKYHESIAFEFKNKIDRLGYLLRFKNGNKFHEFILAIKEQADISDISNIAKDLFKENSNKTRVWKYFYNEIYLKNHQYLLENNIDVKSNNEIKKQIIEQYFQQNQLTSEEIIKLQNAIDLIAPKNTQNYPEGNYREMILVEYLRNILPETVSVGTGFILDEDYHTTNQIDIIVYDSNIAPIFKVGELVVVVPKSVFGIIEVKTTHYPGSLKEELEKANQNYSLIKNSIRSMENIEIFNGIFYFKTNINVPKDILNNSNTMLILKEEMGNVNHISIGDSIFIRNNEALNIYDMERGHLSFAYFFSNLLDLIMKRRGINDTALSSFIFPIEEEGGKLSRLIY